MASMMPAHAHTHAGEYTQTHAHTQRRVEGGREGELMKQVASS